MRPRLRRLRFGLGTVLGLSERGFFIPYRYAAAARPAGYPALETIFRGAEPSFQAVLEAIEFVRDDLAAIAAGKGPARFEQDWFPRLDAAAAYALARREKPKRIVEVGSGHSTRFLVQASLDAGLKTHILCLDPAPRASLDSLKVQHERRLLAEVDRGLFEKLGPGDFLFVDSSHVAMPGTDVDRLFLDIMPRLASGVLIQLHDIFLPDAYPPQWAWRGYNEQLLAGTLLQASGYHLVFASRYLVTRRPERIETGILARLPLLPGALESSLWLRKR